MIICKTALRRTLRWVAVFCGASTVLTPSAAGAQAIQHQVITSWKTVPFIISDDEFPSDFQWNRAGLPSGSNGDVQFYSPNLHQRRRIVGNPSITGVVLQFARVSLNPDAALPAEERDRLDLRWFYDSDSQAQTRLGTNASDIWLTTRTDWWGNSSLSFPGMIFNFRTSAPSAWNGWGQPIQDGEGVGFLTSTLYLIPQNPTNPGSTFQPMFDAHERVTGVLVGGGDAFKFQLPARSTPQTLAVWFQGATTQVTLYARCGAEPNTSDRDVQVSSFDSQGGPLFADLYRRANGTVCNDTWFVALRSTDANHVVFHLRASTHYADKEFGMRIGIAYAPTAAELNNIKNASRRAAWRFYGATSGGFVIRRFDFYPNTPCATWPDAGFACGGGGCHVCWSPVGGLCGYNNDSIGAVQMCRGWAQETGAPLPGRDTSLAATVEVLNHEWGHYWADVGDLYWTSNFFSRVCGMEGIQVNTSGNTIMGDNWESRGNLNVFTTNRTIRKHVEWNHTVVPDGGVPFRVRDGINGDVFRWECTNGETTAGGGAAGSEWAYFTGGNPWFRVSPVNMPLDYTPDNHSFDNFASANRPEIGNIQ